MGSRIMSVAIARPSASLIVLSPLKKLSTDGYNYRLLLVKRSSTQKSFTGHSVFPGGNADAADAYSLWKRLLPQSAGEDEKLTEAKITALRETFEESGILLLPSRSELWDNLSDLEKRNWREKVHADAKVFPKLFEWLSLSPPLSALSYRSNWVTPTTVPRRFDTHFFLAVLPMHDSLSLTEDTTWVEDGKETVALNWHTPYEAIKLSLEHQIELAPPQFYSISELLPFKKWEDAVGVKRVVKPIMPTVKKMEDGTMYTILPGDKDYPGERKGQGVHRNTVSVAKKGTFTVIQSERSGINWGEGWEDFKTNKDTLENFLKSKL